MSQDDPLTATPADHRVVAVLVAHDGADFLPRSLAALEALDPAPDAVVAVDTGSTDATAALLASSSVIDLVVTLPAATGFAAAVHAGIEAAPLGSEAVDPASQWLVAVARRQRAWPVGAGCSSPSRDRPAVGGGLGAQGAWVGRATTPAGSRSHDLAVGSPPHRSRTWRTGPGAVRRPARCRWRSGSAGLLVRRERVGRARRFRSVPAASSVRTSTSAGGRTWPVTGWPWPLTPCFTTLKPWRAAAGPTATTRPPCRRPGQRPVHARRRTRADPPCSFGWAGC